MYDSTADTNAHINNVQARIGELMTELMRRAAWHDMSKLREPEKSGYDYWKPILRTLPEDSAEMEQARREMDTLLQHHYAENPGHHPQGNERGIAGMSLLGLLEMLADWRAGADEKPPHVLLLDYNIKRFGIEPQLAEILRNTVRELGW